MSIASNFPAIKPSLNLDFANTKMLDSRVTFTRASTGTYYDGVTTAKAEENLLLYSQEFDNAAWTNTATTETANSTTAPDGTSTADTLTPTASTAVHEIQQTLSVVNGLPYTVSCFVKPNGNNFVQLAFGSTGFGTTQFANFNVSAGAGAVGTVGAAATASIVDAGNGWYRCSMTATATSTTTSGSLSIVIISSSTSARRESWATTGTEQLFLWGAQLEQRSTVTAYTATTTQAITNYVPVLLTAQSGVPRFDHNPTTDESLGFLLEESRTNLLVQSEDFDTTWSETRATLSLNSVVAPNGTLTADRLIASTDNNTHFTSQTFTGTAASHTFSVYAKASGLNHVALRLFNGTSQVGLAYYNLSTGATGTVTAGTATITSVGNSWYRCTLTATLAASASCTADVYLASADNTNSFAGDAFNGVTLWGAQLEAGAFATSYIQTVAATVTRAADAAIMTGTNFSSWFSAAEYTLFSEWDQSYVATGYEPYQLQFSDGTLNNRIVLYADGTAETLFVGVGGVSQVFISRSTVTANQTAKAAARVKTNDFALVLNGGAAATDTSGTVPTVTQFALGQNIVTAGTKLLNGHLRRVAYYPMALSTANLQALTS